MKIGQISFMQMTEPTCTPYGSYTLGSKYQRHTARPDALPLLRRTSSDEILVTGGTGFVGSRIVHALRARARDVPRARPTAGGAART